MTTRRTCNCMAVPPPRAGGRHHPDWPTTPWRDGGGTTGVRPTARRDRRRSPSALPFVAWTVIGVTTIALVASVIAASPVLATLAVSATLLGAVFALLRARRWGALALVSTAAVLLALLIEAEIAVSLMAVGLGGLLVVRIVAMHEGWIPRRILSAPRRVSTVPARGAAARSRTAYRPDLL